MMKDLILFDSDDDDLQATQTVAHAVWGVTLLIFCSLHYALCNYDQNDYYPRSFSYGNKSCFI